VNNHTKRIFAVVMAGSFFAGAILSAVSAKSSPEAGSEAQTTLDSEISTPATASKIQAGADQYVLLQGHPSGLADYAFSEVPPDKKPADIVLDSLKDVPVGAPVEEIKRASAAFGVDFNFMKAIARIESGFDPKERTGSYFGLFQLSKDEFAKYGSGDILDARDNAVAAAYKFATEAILFELNTHKKATFGDLYLIHQQGAQGAEEHVNHPDRIAWKSMCATDEGKAKGEDWCKRAIWENTLPDVKRVWKSVDNLTSGAFVQMWRDRVDHFYTRYAEATTNETPVVAK
jgi:hypothetical protein